MLIDILRMPPAFGIPMDRRLTVCADPQIPQGILEPVVHWPNVPLIHKRLMVGSLIDIVPQNLYKSIHVSDDNGWVFETVFAVESPTDIVCLYTKMISKHDVQMGISLNACRRYQHTRTNLLPLANFLASWENSFNGRYDVALPINNKTSQSIIPPVFGERALWSHIHRLLDIQQLGSPEPTLGRMYRPLFNHAPAVLEALMEGQFRESPFYEISGRYPGVEIVRDKWFDYESLSYQADARGYQSCQINFPAFDSIALALVGMNPAKFTVSTLLSHAIDAIPALWLTRAYYDPYQPVLYGQTFNDSRYSETLSDILHRAVMAYCKIHRIDYNMYIENSEDRSSVTISKNIYDEIVITFHDMISDRYEAYYTSFPTLALSTLSAGWYR